MDEDTIALDTTSADSSFHDTEMRRRKVREDPLHITDESTLQSALRHFRGLPEKERAAAMGRIVNRARQLKLTRLLPREWNVTQEPKQISAVLQLETVNGAITLEAAPEGAPDGVMRIKVPFYVGGSVARTPAIKKPILFPASILDQIVNEGNSRIAEGKQPLTVYARHSHAMSAEEMPIGRIVQLEHDNRVGHAVIDIVDDGRYGTQTQRLIKAGMLNAVSLRSDEFELEDAKVNGQVVLEAKVLQLTGIDFAPDGPAQPTFGIEVLAAEAVVEHDVVDEDDEPSTPPKEEPQHMDITLEKVRAEAPAVVQEIERPLNEQIANLTSERDAAVSERDELKGRVIELERVSAKAEADAEVARMAAEFPDPAKAVAILAEACKDCANAAEVKATAAPILLEAMKAVTAPKPAEGETKPAGALLAELFGKPQGQVITQEESDETDETGETAWGLSIPA